MIVRELLTRLGFSADNDAARRHERALMNVRRAAVLTVAAVTATGTAMVFATRRTANAAIETERFARLANATTTEYQRMAVGAESVGIENEKLSDILKDMNDRVGDFIQTGGGPMLDFFEQIAPQVGVTAEQFRTLSGPEALQLYVSSLEKANLSQADMVFFMEAIASDSTALLPILQNNGEALTDIADRAQRFGAILSDDVIAAGQGFRASLAGVRQIATGLVYTIGERLMPVVTQTLESFIDWYEVNGDMIRQNLARFIENFTQVVSAFWSVMSTVLTVVNDVAQSMGGWEVVLRLVLAALAAITARSVIAGIMGLAGAMRAAGGAAAFLRGAIRRIPGVLALIAFAAILEDLWAWVNGTESAIGMLLGTWDDFKAKWAENLEGIRTPFALFAAGLKSIWDTIIAPILDKLGFLDPIMGAWNTLADTLVTAMDRIAGAVEWLTGKWAEFKAAVGIDGGVTGPYGAGAREMLPLVPGASALPFPGTGGAPGSADATELNSFLSGLGPSTNTVNANITMQVPPGTPETQVEYLRSQSEPMFNRLMEDSITRAQSNYAGAE